MAIANIADVKLLAALYSILGEGAPTTSTAGIVGDIYLDIDQDSATYGKTYLMTGLAETAYTWIADVWQDTSITRMITRAEQDYLQIRGREFETDDYGAVVYPDGADIVGAEMACYLLGLYEGRGLASGSIGGKSSTYEKKIAGYPVSIVGQIDRYVGVG